MVHNSKVDRTSVIIKTLQCNKSMSINYLKFSTSSKNTATTITILEVWNTKQKKNQHTMFVYIQKYTHLYNTHINKINTNKIEKQRKKSVRMQFYNQHYWQKISVWFLFRSIFFFVSSRMYFINKNNTHTLCSQAWSKY